MENLKNLTQTYVSSIDGDDKNSVPVKKFLLFLLIVIVIGGAAGFLLSSFKNLAGKNIGAGPKQSVKQTAGISDKKTFKDRTEGILREGGIDGEGSYHLDRPGGQSQNVYLTSSKLISPNMLVKKSVSGDKHLKGKKLVG